jgi:hypothetical protein
MAIFYNLTMSTIPDLPAIPADALPEICHHGNEMIINYQGFKIKIRNNTYIHVQHSDNVIVSVNYNQNNKIHGTVVLNDTKYKFDDGIMCT